MADDSGEKTEEATSKKIEDSRKEGNVPKSMDMAGFVALAVAVMALVAMIGYIFDKLKRIFRNSFANFGEELTQDTLASIGLSLAWEVLTMVIPLAAVVGLFASIGYIMQFGFLFTTKPLEPNLKKINPISGLKNLFSMQKLTDGLKITLKVTIAMSVMGQFLWSYTSELTTVHYFDLPAQIKWLAEKVLILALVMLLIFFIFAIIDIAIVRYFHFKKLRMTKQEIKDEYKNTDGNPEIKAKIRKVQMEMSRNRMMKDVPTADVVVTNPTHYAVALRYKVGEDVSPVVVAKGLDHVAIKIKEIAREHNITIVERPELARELYKLLDVGQPVPEKLFGAVAEVLNYAYRASNRGFGGA